MVSIQLNRDIFMQHMRMFTPVKYMFKDRYLRDKYKYKECLLLTQNEDTLIYTTVGETHALQSYEKVAFQIPYPIALNLDSVSCYKSGNQIVLEIPDCTLAGLRTFYDVNRPKYINDSDLKTSVVAINGRRANLEYINPTHLADQFDYIVSNAKINPITNWQDYQWFNRNYNGDIQWQNIDSVYKTVFYTDAGILPNTLEHPSESRVLKYLEQLQSAAKSFGALYRESHNNDTDELDKYKIPFALFQDNQQSVIWQGIPQKQK